MLGLNTLNDIWNVKEDGTPGCDDCDVHDRFVATRKEAIKWYKYHEQQIQGISEHSSENKQVMRMMSINGWLWHFFDLTDEEIKDVYCVEDVK